MNFVQQRDKDILKRQGHKAQNHIAKASNKGLAAVITGILDGMGLQFVTEPEFAKEEEVWKTTEEVVWAFLEWNF